MTHLLIIILLQLQTGAPLHHCDAALAASTPGVSARQLLRQSWRESRWQAPGRLVVSRMEGSRRVTGYLSTFAGTSGPYFCGTLQLKRHTPAKCRAINADYRASYVEAVAHIEQWHAYCIRTGRASDQNWKTCALAGYAGGVKATRMRGRAWRYARAVLREAGELPSAPGASQGPSRVRQRPPA